ncbi:hypothetical protein ACQRIT_000429 [Beauveria bassiana]
MVCCHHGGTGSDNAQGQQQQQQQEEEEERLLLAPRPLYGPVKATMLADGHAVAAGLVVAAVLGNHVRRVLAPWLGQFLWWHPVQAMRLARGTPHLFIEQQVLAATDAATLGFWALQTIALAATKALLDTACWPMPPPPSPPLPLPPSPLPPLA